jgi:aminoglycoside 3-N-acetyltransferase
VGAGAVGEDPIDTLSHQWREAGVRDGDILLVHSRLGRTIRALVTAGRPAATAPDYILASFLTALGPNGTLLLPLFNFDFAKGVPFDLRSTPSQMGALTEAGRRHPGAVRTGHPIYSFAVIGHEAERFRGLTNFSGYGTDSPFALLRAMGGRIGVLDLPDQHSMTYYHHVEECLAAPYRYHKRFTGSYTGWDGIAEMRTFGLYVRDIERGVTTNVDPMGELLWQRGLYRGDRPGQASGFRTIEAPAFYEAVGEIIREGRAEGLLYRIEGPAP